MMERMVIPPASKMEVMVRHQNTSMSGTWIVESDASSHLGVMVGHGLVCPNGAGLYPIRVLNPEMKGSY